MYRDRVQVSADGGQPLFRRFVAEHVPILERHRQPCAAVFGDRRERLAFRGWQRQEFVHEPDRRLAVGRQRLLVERVGLRDVGGRRGRFAARGTSFGLRSLKGGQGAEHFGKNDVVRRFRFLILADAVAEARLELVHETYPQAAEQAGVAIAHEVVEVAAATQRAAVELVVEPLASFRLDVHRLLLRQRPPRRLGVRDDVRRSRRTQRSVGEHVHEIGEHECREGREHEDEGVAEERQQAGETVHGRRRKSRVGLLYKVLD